MADPQLWRAIEAQAKSWAVLPIFLRFAAQLPRNAPQRSRGVPGLLQHMQAGGGWVGSRPLRLGFIAEQLLDGLPGPSQGGIDEEFAPWLDDARRVESAHRDTVAWLRSRLPGYPSLPAPHLAPGTPMTTTEFTWRLIWAPRERAQGLQFLSAPPQTGPVLQTTEGELRRLDETARALAAALERTDEWTRLVAATGALDSDARASLRRTRSALRLRLAEEAVTAHEPSLAMIRDNYRHVALSEEIEALPRAAREYSDAFGFADQLVETVASDVFGQLAAYGEPLQYPPPQHLDVGAGSPQMVTFTISDSMWSETGSIVWVNDPLVPDAVHITTVTVNINAVTGDVQRVTGTVLAGTAAAWRPTA